MVKLQKLTTAKFEVSMIFSYRRLVGLKRNISDDQNPEASMSYW